MASTSVSLPAKRYNRILTQSRWSYHMSGRLHRPVLLSRVMWQLGPFMRATQLFMNSINQSKMNSMVMGHVKKWSTLNINKDIDKTLCFRCKVLVIHHVYASPNQDCESNMEVIKHQWTCVPSDYSPTYKSARYNWTILAYCSYIGIRICFSRQVKNRKAKNTFEVIRNCLHYKATRV